MRARSSGRRLARIVLALMLVACAKSSPQKQMGQSACTSDAECGTGAICVQGSCAPASVPMCGTALTCQADGDCPTMQCQASACCALPCQMDSDCPDGQSCAGSVCSDTGICTSSADCPHTGAPVCNTATGVCQQCLNDNQCPAGDVCDTGGGCVSGQPMGGCSTNADCANTGVLPYCDTSTPPGHCVACLQDANCSNNGSSICVHEVCQTVSATCSYNGDCDSSPNGQYCAANGQCVACVSDSDCPAGQTCQTGNMCANAVGCMSDAMCPHSTPECRPTDHVCVQCFLNSQCGPTPSGGAQICRNGNCVPPVNGCVSDTDCTSALPVCDTQTRTCVGCLSNAQCGAFCQNGTCQQCTSNEQCAETFLSLNRLFCSQSGACVQCTGDVDCSGSNQVCANGECITDPTNQPCEDGGTCYEPDQMQLICVQDGAQTGTCRAVCNIYGDSSECIENTQCGVIAVQNGQPEGACVPATPGASAIGGTCSATQKCNSNAVCVQDSPTTSHCYGLCDPNANSTCGGSDKCQNVAVLGPSNTPITLGACFPSTSYGDPCETSGQCDTNQVCGESPNPNDPLVLQNACVWAAGSGGPGAPCSKNSDCQTDVCLFGMPNGQGAPGFCDGACTSDSMCPKRPDGLLTDACEPYPAPWHSQTGAADTTPVVTCTPQCRDTDECPAGTVCDFAPDESGTSWATRCVATSSQGMSAGGVLCYANSDCISNHCLVYGPGTAGICAGVCDAATAAKACGSGAQCPSGGVVLQVGTGANGAFAPAPICWGPSCTSNANCVPVDVCVGTPAPDNQSDIVLACQPIEGSLGGGSPCTTDGDCESGWCVTWSSGDRCFGACNPAHGSSDCTGGSVCDTGYWTNTTPHSMVSYCAPPS